MLENENLSPIADSLILEEQCEKDLDFSLPEDFILDLMDEKNKKEEKEKEDISDLFLKYAALFIDHSFSLVEDEFYQKINNRFVNEDLAKKMISAHIFVKYVLLANEILSDEVTKTVVVKLTDIGEKAFLYIDIKIMRLDSLKILKIINNKPFFEFLCEQVRGSTFNDFFLSLNSKKINGNAKNKNKNKDEDEKTVFIEQLFVDDLSEKYKIEVFKKEVKENISIEKKPLSLNNLSEDEESIFLSNVSDISLIAKFNPKACKKSEYVVSTAFLHSKTVNHMYSILMGERLENNALVSSFLTENPCIMHPIGFYFVEHNALELLEQLKEDFPNFYEVTDYIIEYVKFCKMKDVPIKIPNILLNGMSGFGKSFYCLTLSKVLNMIGCLIPMSNISTGAELTGLSTVWSNGQPGLILESIVDQEKLNPLIILDELEKSESMSNNGTNPHYSLLNMTDSKMSKSFKETFLKTNIDFGYINWIATSNSTESINSALLKRFKIFNISAPDKVEIIVIIKRIYTEALKELDLVQDFNEEISETCIELLKKENPRNIMEIIKSGILKTFIAGIKANNKFSLSVIKLKNDKKRRSYI